MKREYSVTFTTGKAPTAGQSLNGSDFHFTHKKQKGGAGQFARVIGYVEPMELDAESLEA